MFTLTETEQGKILRSDTYNYIFNKINGTLIRWGRTLKQDALFSPYGPEILDIEVTTKCTNGCPFCYKSNTSQGKNMSLDTFKSILDKMPKTLTQVAFGADSNLTSNPDIFKMMEYCHERQVVPNVTIADCDISTATNLSRLCGAVAVSRYLDKDACYNSVSNLINCGLTQTNIHVLISKETLAQALETVNDYKTDPRLKNLNAIVFLSLKQKGRGDKYTPLTQEEFNILVNHAQTLDVPIGFDSCSTSKFFNVIKGSSKEQYFKTLVEPCESFGIFSSYINVDGDYFPCSFCENKIKPISVLTTTDFVKDVWNNPLINRLRQETLERYSKGNYSCPIYNV
jgi:MoaA/NifB/PqqE/SkfB family radical SAM enzyme